MATVYSLVCFGGLSGKTVTFTDAGDVCNLTNHGLRQGVTGVVFSTTGSLPTGITAGTTYYPRDGADAGKFTIYPTNADALAGTNQVTFTGTGSGTHKVKSAYMLGLNSTQLARYGSAGSERIYDGIFAWYNARYNSDLANVEVCEVGECFDEITTSYLPVTGFVAKMIITSRVNGVFSSAFHNGIVGGGYRLISSYSSQHIININMYNVDIIGIEICRNSSKASPTYSIINQGSTGYAGVIDRCIVNGMSVGEIKGITTGAGTIVSNNIILGCLGSTAGGLELNTPQGALVYNNLIVKNGVGLKGSTSIGQGKLYNNVVIGNTVNYSARPGYIPTTCLRNVGQNSDLLAFTVTNGSSNLTFSVGHNVITASYTGICFQSTGTLPTVGGTPLVAGKMYPVRARTSATVITISLTQGGTALTFDGVGTGTHYASAVWVTEDNPLMIDFSAPNSVFVDYSNNDFRLASGSPLINAGINVSGLASIAAEDIKGDVRPNYQPSIYPNEVWDVGPFEHDHGNGLAPQQVTLSISGMANGSILAVYKTSDGSAIISPTTIGASGSYSTTYSYTGNVQIEVVVRKGSGGTKYLPYSAPGLVTSTGFSLIVNQVADGVLNG